MKKTLKKKVVFIFFIMLSFSKISFSQDCYRVYVNMTSDYTFYDELKTYFEAIIERDGLGAFSNIDCFDVNNPSDVVYTDCMRDLMNNAFNTAANFYEQYNITLVKGEVNVISNSNNDPYINIGSNGHTILDKMADLDRTEGGNFGVNQYTNKLGFTYDINALFTGINIYGIGENGNQTDPIGLVDDIGNLYTDRSLLIVEASKSFTIDPRIGLYPIQLSIIPRTFVHEIGHLFGGIHDDASSNSIMTASGGSISVGFSNANRLNISALLQSEHHDFIFSANGSVYRGTYNDYAIQSRETIYDRFAHGIISDRGTYYLRAGENMSFTNSGTNFKVQNGGKIVMKVDNNIDCIEVSSSFPQNRNSNSKKSKISEVENDTPLEAENIVSNVTLYPNPTDDYVNLNLSLSKNSSVNVSVFDFSGRYLFDLMKQNSYLKGKHQKQFNLSRLSQGVYFIKVDAENNSKTYKIIKK